MIIIKFIVLFGFISVLSALQTYYCEICSNHTLCQYKVRVYMLYFVTITIKRYFTDSFFTRGS